MDKLAAVHILRPYSPPLSRSQIEEISDKIVEISEAEIAKAVKKAKARFKRAVKVKAKRAAKIKAESRKSESRS